MKQIQIRKGGRPQWFEDAALEVGQRAAWHQQVECWPFYLDEGGFSILMRIRLRRADA